MLSLETQNFQLLIKLSSKRTFLRKSPTAHINLINFSQELCTVKLGKFTFKDKLGHKMKKEERNGGGKARETARNQIC